MQTIPHNRIHQKRLRSNRITVFKIIRRKLFGEELELLGFVWVLKHLKLYNCGQTLMSTNTIELESAL